MLPLRCSFPERTRHGPRHPVPSGARVDASLRLRAGTRSSHLPIAARDRSRSGIRMNLPIETLAGGGLVVAFAYTVVGLTGFGASMVAMPMLWHLLPLCLALPTMLVYDLIGGVAIGVRNRRSVDRGELLRLVPFMLIGVALGVNVLVKAPERALLLLLGVFVLAFAAWSLLFRPRQATIAPGWAVPLGTVGGVFSALFGTGGPIYTIYLARRVQDKGRLRATISLLLFMS